MRIRRPVAGDLDRLVAFLRRHLCLPTWAVQDAAESAIAASPKDTALFLFRQAVEAFCRRLAMKQEEQSSPSR